MKDIRSGIRLTEEVADEICERIADGESLITICKNSNMPSAVTFWKWVKRDETLRQKYDEAKKICLEKMAEEILEIADNQDEIIQRSAVRIDARKWLLTKLAPKKYGDKAQITGDGGGPVQMIIATGVPRATGD